MAETPGKIRLVRCPKCRTILPEITGGADVYRCGGCGAVLQAKNKSVVSDTFSEKSENDVKLSKRTGMKMDDRDEIDVKSSNSSSVSEGEYNSDSLKKAEKWDVEEDLEMIKNAHELGNLETAQILFKTLKAKSGSSANLSRIPVGTYDQEKDETDRFQNTQNTDALCLTNSEGPSNDHPGSGYDHSELVNDRQGRREVNRARYVEDDRAELLRMVAQLQNQLSQAHQMVDRSKEQVSHGGRRVGYQDPYNSGPENWFPAHSNRVPMKYPTPDIIATSQYSIYNDTSSHTSSQGLGVPYGSNMFRKAPQRDPKLFEQGPSYPYYSGKYINKGAADMSLHVDYRHNSNPPHMAHSVLPIEKFLDVPHHPVSYRREYPYEFAPRDYNPRFSDNPSISSSNSPWSSDYNSEYGGFVRHPPRTVHMVTSRRRCHPVSGGAPFVTCRNCYALLQLPNKVLSKVKTQKKMRCAACSELIFVSVVHKKLVLSVHSQSKEVLKKVDNTLNAVVNEDNSHTQGSRKWPSSEFSSYNYDNWGYALQSMDAKVLSSLTRPSIGSDKSADVKSHHSTSSYTSVDEEESKVVELGIAANTPPPPSDSPVKDHVDYFTKYDLAGTGNNSGRSEVNKVIPPLKTDTSQNSMKDVTEIEIPSNEYSINTGTFQESEISIREDRIRNIGGGESFFADIVKKSFRDFMKPSQHVKEKHINVTVNGHPIPEQLLKKAEKLAGKIQPGDYWYDSRAGFWGVIGGPCLGIIPPSIKEFNYPMPENCACGNTGVFVNGRELHYKDLKLLGSRGLPTDTDGSYIIEISGRVLDVESGEELDSLGKLAPTIEKAKRGFGMKVPRAAS